MTDARKPVRFVKTGQALQSLRYSGYTLEAAIAEVIDNSIEANANNIYVNLYKPDSKKDKIQVGQILFIDDGDGMSEEELHYYPQIGYSSRYMRQDTIGKYGVGAKLAALSVARRFDAWSRTEVNQPFYHVYLDLDQLLDEESRMKELTIGTPVLADLPRLAKEIIQENKSTVVRWDNIDTIDNGRLAANFEGLCKHLEKELSRMFRHFIDGGINIWLNGKKLLAFDPLYLMENSFNDLALKNYYKNDEANQKDHYKPTVIADEDIIVDKSKARIKITLYPYELVRKRGVGGDTLATTLHLLENKGSISFIRANREVSYTNVPRIFHRGIEDPDRFIGIEVSFQPDLDTYFGVRNVKRGVEPHGDLRKNISTLLEKYLREARELIDEHWGKVEKENKSKNGEHSTVVNAAKQVNPTLPKGRVKIPDKKTEQDILDDLARDVVGDDETAKATYLEKVKEEPFILHSMDYPGDKFLDIKHLANQIIIRLNTRHRFYREMWEPLKSISERDPSTITADETIKSCKRAVEALTLMLIAFGKAESMDPQPFEKYGELTNLWGTYLSTLMNKVKDVL